MNGGTRALRHESELGSWELVLRAPDPRLSGLVSDYQGYVERGSPPPLRQQVPTTFLPLIVNFGSPWGIGDSEDGAPTAYGSFLAGLGERSSYVRATGPASCIQVNLTPLAAHMFLGLPMHELANRVVTLEDVLPRRARRLTERLEDAPTWEERFELLDAVFSARLADGAGRRPETSPGRGRCSSARTARRRSGGSATSWAGAAGTCLDRFREQVAAQAQDHGAGAPLDSAACGS